MPASALGHPGALPAWPPARSGDGCGAGMPTDANSCPTYLGLARPQPGSALHSLRPERSRKSPRRRRPLLAGAGPPVPRSARDPCGPARRRASPRVRRQPCPRCGPQLPGAARVEEGAGARLAGRRFKPPCGIPPPHSLISKPTRRLITQPVFSWSLEHPKPLITLKHSVFKLHLSILLHPWMPKFRLTPAPTPFSTVSPSAYRHGPLPLPSLCSPALK